MVVLYENSSQCGNNPASNTGLDSQATFPKNSPIAFVHWIQGVCIGDFEEITDFIAKTIKKCPVYHKSTTTHIGTQWSGFAQFSDGVKTYYREYENTTRVGFSVTGNVCEQLGTRDCWRLIRGLYFAYKCKFTRVDLKLRVDRKNCSIDRIEEEAIKKNMTGVRTAPRTYIGREFKGDECIECKTVYLGSSESDCQLRVYDPFAMHKIAGKTDIELQLRDEKAQEAVNLLCGIESDLQNADNVERNIGIMIGRIVLGQVSFIQRTKDKNTKRSKVLDFWQALLDLVGQGVKLVTAFRKSSFARFKQFVRTKAFNGLAALEESMGIPEFYQWFRTEMADRRGNLPSHWEALVEEEKRYSV